MTESMVCCLSCRKTFQPARVGIGCSCGGTSEGEEGRRRGRRYRGAALIPDMQHWAARWGRLQSSAWFLTEVSKPSCHEQLMEFAFQVRKPGINKSSAKGHNQTCVAAACYSNILLPVSSPTGSICFLSCLLFCKHYGGYCSQKSTLTSHYPGLSFLPSGCPLLYARS